MGLASSRGAQLFGTARVMSPEHPEYAAHWEAVRLENKHSEPPRGALVVVDADRIVYTEHWLRREGFAPRQFWRRD